MNLEELQILYAMYSRYVPIKINNEPIKKIISSFNRKINNPIKIKAMPIFAIPVQLFFIFVNCSIILKP